MAEKVILGLCTSGSRLKVAVSSGPGTFCAQRREFNQERVLLPVVKGLLAKAGADLRGLDAVCAARGPGRFTGIRIALTLAGALKALSGTAVYTATLFEVLALQASGSPHFAAWAGGRERRLAVLLHAFKDEYFCQFFSAAPGATPRAAGEPAWLKAGELRDLLASERAPFYLIADAEEEPGIYSLAPAAAAPAPAAISRVLPAAVISAALAWRNTTLKPLYLKPAKYELENNVRPRAARR